MTTSKMFDLVAEQLENAQQVPDPFQRQHIFHSILAYSAEHESAGARMDMMFRFSQCQRALGNMVRGNLALADDQVASMRGTPLHLASALAQAGIDAIESAMIAYKYYAVRDYTEAHACLDRSREFFCRLIDSGLARAALGLLDLELNAIRVHVASGQTAQAVAQSIDVLALLYGGRGRLARVDIDFAATMSAAELRSIRDFFTDALLAKLIGTNDFPRIRALFAGLCASSAGWPRNALRTAFDYYAKLLDGPAPADADAGFVASAALAALPASVQYLIVFAMLAQDPQAAQAATVARIRRHFGTRRELAKLRDCAWCDERRWPPGQGAGGLAAVDLPALV